MNKLLKLVTIFIICILPIMAQVTTINPADPITSVSLPVINSNFSNLQTQVNKGITSGSLGPASNCPSGMTNGSTYLDTAVTPNVSMSCVSGKLTPVRAGAAYFRLADVDLPVMVLAGGQQFGLVAGHNNILTCPKGDPVTHIGDKYCILGVAAFYNPTGGSISVNQEVFHTTRYYTSGGLASYAAGATNAYNFTAMMAPGDILSYNATAPGLVLSHIVYEFDALTSPIIPVWLYGVTSGTTNVAVIPTGFTGQQVYLPGSFNQALSSFFISPNAHTGAVGIQLTPSGQTVGAGFTIYSVIPTTAVRNGPVNGSFFYLPGTTLSLTVDATDTDALVFAAVLLQPISLN